jgi:hypothetical protein
MAIDSNSLTLAEYALLSNDVAVRAITWDMIDKGSIAARDIPFVTKKTLKVNGIRWTTDLPDVNWVKLNEEGPVVKGKPGTYSEQAWILRNRIHTDHLLVEEENQIANPHEAQVKAYLWAQVLDFNDKFFNNKHAGTGSDEDAPVGIRTRLDNPDDYGVLSTLKMDAAATMTTAATAVQVAGFYAKLDELLEELSAPDGSGVVLYMPFALKSRMDFLAKVHAGAGGFGTATDQLGRTVETYKGAVIRDPGRKANQTTKIITATETTAGLDGASTYTSLYAVKFGGMGLRGWQFNPLRVINTSTLENEVINQTAFEWVMGIVSESRRSFGRLFNINLG